MGNAAVQLFDAVAEHDAVDPAFFIAATTAHMMLDDLPRAERCAAVMRKATDTADPRSVFWTAIAQNIYLGAARRSAEAISWADQALNVATRHGSQSGIAFALLVRAKGRRDDWELARHDAQSALETAQGISPEHVIVGGSLGELAVVASFEDDLPTALRACRTTIGFSVGVHHLSSLAGNLQVAAVVLTRAGDPRTAARIIRSTAGHGYRTAKRAESIIAAALGPDGLTALPAERLSMLDTAQLAIDAIDHLMALTTATNEPGPR